MGAVTKNNTLSLYLEDYIEINGLNKKLILGPKTILHYLSAFNELISISAILEICVYIYLISLPTKDYQLQIAKFHRLGDAEHPQVRHSILTRLPIRFSST